MDIKYTLPKFIFYLIWHRVGESVVIGCYEWDLIWEYNSQGYLTHTLCRDSCLSTNESYRYSGTYASSCYCRMNAPNRSLKICNEKCTYRCDGDGTQRCGGYPKAYMTAFDSDQHVTSIRPILMRTTLVLTGIQKTIASPNVITGKAYNGIVIGNFTTSSIITCIAKCNISNGCTATEFRKSTKMCVLKSSSDECDMHTDDTVVSCTIV